MHAIFRLSPLIFLTEHRSLWRLDYNNSYGKIRDEMDFLCPPVLY